MNSQEIIARIKGIYGTREDVLAALENTNLLKCMGVTDADKNSVEVACSKVSGIWWTIQKVVRQGVMIEMRDSDRKTVAMWAYHYLEDNYGINCADNSTHAHDYLCEELDKYSFDDNDDDEYF